MLLFSLNRRPATAIRLAGLIAVAWTVLDAHNGPSTTGRGAVALGLFVVVVLAWLVWTLWSSRQAAVTPDLFVLAGAGGLLCATTTSSAASACVFVAVVAASIRLGLVRALPVLALGVVALAVGAIVYHDSAVGVLAYSLGFAAAMLGGTNVRQSIVRADQAELLLAQTQRSHEEQLRAARLQESARIARDIHDLLAHTLAGLTIQLEATEALLDQGTDPQSVRGRVQRARELAQEGLRETRLAVGALRGDRDPEVPLGGGLELLAEQYRAAGANAILEISGDPGLLSDAERETVLRITQEALTNVHKHAGGAAVTITLEVGDELRLAVDNGPPGMAPAAAAALAGSGGGYGLRGMRERAELLGGEIVARPTAAGWRVELRLPLAAAGPRARSVAG